MVIAWVLGFAPDSQKATGRASLCFVVLRGPSGLWVWENRGRELRSLACLLVERTHLYEEES